jgi:dTDP-4-amino-4,6-dideoxygalactose transaminase
MGREYGYAADDLPHTEELAGRLLRLPIHQQLDETACERIVSEINTFYDDRE